MIYTDRYNKISGRKAMMKPRVIVYHGYSWYLKEKYPWFSIKLENKRRAHWELSRIKRNHPTHDWMLKTELDVKNRAGRRGFLCSRCESIYSLRSVLYTCEEVMMRKAMG